MCTLKLLLRHKLCRYIPNNLIFFPNKKDLLLQMTTHGCCELFRSITRIRSKTCRQEDGETNRGCGLKDSKLSVEVLVQLQYGRDITTPVSEQMQ